MVAVEKVGKRPQARPNPARGSPSRPGTSELREFAERMVAPGSTIRTDGARMLRSSGAGLHPRVHQRLQRAGQGRGAARRAPGRLTAQALADRHPALRGRPTTNCPTTSTSSPSGSTAATPTAAACSSTDSSSKRSTPTRTPAHDFSGRSPIRTSLKQIPRTYVRLYGIGPTVLNPSFRYPQRRSRVFAIGRSVRNRGRILARRTVASTGAHAYCRDAAGAKRGQLPRRRDSQDRGWGSASTGAGPTRPSAVSRFAKASSAASTSCSSYPPRNTDRRRSP